MGRVGAVDVGIRAVPPAQMPMEGSGVESLVRAGVARVGSARAVW